jgi:hypothetical protein
VLNSAISQDCIREKTTMNKAAITNFVIDNKLARGLNSISFQRGRTVLLNPQLTRKKEQKARNQLNDMLASKDRSP